MLVRHWASGKWLLLCLWMLTGAACRNANEVTPAFYYWKTTWQPSPRPERVFKEGDFRKLYLRLCDIGIDPASGQVIPKDVLRAGEKAKFPQTEIVPVIFLEPPALKTLQNSAFIAGISGNIARFVSAFCRQQGWNPKEFQLDCDWTAKTAEPYFALLRALKKEPYFSGKILSVTLRGHQVKYPAKSGIPPADRCMLMAYNMGDIRTLTPESSILDVPTAKDYLQNIGAYPLPLDLALPIFRWTLWYRRGQLLGILRGVDPEQLPQVPFLQKEKNKPFYISTADTSLSGYRLQAGDVLKAESPQPNELIALAKYVSGKLPAQPYTVTFYHLDDPNLIRYDTRQLEEILRHCR